MTIEELKITNEDINLLNEMKENCLKASVYKDEKRLLKANAITKFLVEHQEKQELIEYLKNQIKSWKDKIFENSLTEDNFTLALWRSRLITYEKILDKIEKK